MSEVRWYVRERLDGRKQGREIVGRDRVRNLRWDDKGKGCKGAGKAGEKKMKVMT